MKMNSKRLELPFSLPLDEPLSALKKSGNAVFVNVANASAKSFLLQQLGQQKEVRNIFWASNSEKADVLEAAARLFFDGEIAHLGGALSAEETYKLLSAVETKTPHLFLFEDIVAISNQKFPSPKSLKAETILIKIGDEIAPYSFFEDLTKKGYAPCADPIVSKGQFVRRGDSLFICPINTQKCFRIELFGDEVETISEWNQSEKKVIKKEKSIAIPPADFSKIKKNESFFTLIKKAKNSLFIADDLDDLIEDVPIETVEFTSFPPDEKAFWHINFFGILPYYTQADFVTDIKERLRREYSILIYTKRFAELQGILADSHIMWSTDPSNTTPSTVLVYEADATEFMPHSFQNSEQKILFLTDREIWQFARNQRQKKAISGMNTNLLTSLKTGDYVVHMDHGLSRFGGIVQREIGIKTKSTREYLQLEYAEKDRLFLPVENAEKVTKFLGENAPKLTKLDSNDWQRTQKKLKKETEEIAADLLKVFAAREIAKGNRFVETDEMLDDFCASFKYELTPGQAGAWYDVGRDMESPRPMDRLVCGDVGFGKTEIAMRAAFKAFRSGYQTAFLSPITILAEQHYESYMQRIAGKKYGVKIALLSRFQSASEQKKILAEIEKGTVDIVIGTHRLLSKDVKFKKLGLVVIDEEQRFGVKQKEKLKAMRANIDLLTLTATPIPRTLNLSLNKLKEISTITTPPPGRLPVITEVRRYSPVLIRERILAEIEREGQIYFLHNEVKTIEEQAHQIRQLVPEARVVVAHGQMTPKDLEDRIHQFKEGEFDVLVASTIIENGIDLARANTLIVNKADKFGLSQLYQLRGRVGRSRTQAYAYFLYQKQRLEPEAKKRLRAIVEASELGSGFQIAMRDLEIRGAGELLGASQSGAMRTVGVSHFMRILHQTIEKMKSGEMSNEVDASPEESVSVEVPLSAYIPSTYIPSTDEKIRIYQELAGVSSLEYLTEMKHELLNSYGKLPESVENLCRVIRLKIMLKAAHLGAVRIAQASAKNYEIILRMGKGFSPEQIFGLVQMSPRQWTVTAEALKLKIPNLNMTWYEDLTADIALLLPQKKKEKTPKQKS